MHLDESYFNWLVCQIDDGRASGYLELLNALYREPFKPITRGPVKNDVNREEDGYSLRDRYISEELPFEPSDRIGPEFCSMFEMMVALAFRMEDILYDTDQGYRVPIWFWIMVKNLGLYHMNDRNFEQDIFDEIMEIFMTRSYEKSGHKGGLFTTFDEKIDMRKTEIWYQMQYFITENQF